VNIVLLGPPGSGKGTQGDLLAKALRIPRVSTGDLLRDAAKRMTALGLEARRYMDQGLLVPDQVILKLIAEVLAAPGSRNGILMDGFPRTVAQAEAVDGLLRDRGAKVDRAVSITVAADELTHRMLKRARDQGRADDTPETIGQRLQVYERETAPLITYYRERGVLTEVDGVGTIEAIARRIMSALTG
jgi:adenylate kinase